MFAKVFSQIFDSSIAEDYNCRRMFMDLLVLADSEGVIDMTPEAIARRTNVPVEEVVKYVAELCQPDIKSRSKLHEGKRLIPLDTNRDWGWIIVNYHHYREVRDEESRREYFRNAMRKSRQKKRSVKYKLNTSLTTVNKVKPPASASSSVSASDSSWIEELCTNETYKGIDVRREFGKMEAWCKVRGYVPSKRRFVNWLNRADRPVAPNGTGPLTKFNLPLPPRCSIRKDGEVLDYTGRVMDVNQVRAALKNG